MSLSLSGVTALCGSMGLHRLSILSDVAALAWVKAAWDLSGLVPTRHAAQETYSKAESSKLRTLGRQLRRESG